MPSNLSSLSLPTSSSSPSTSSFTSYFNSLTRKRQQKKMSITQTYYLAHTARRKLTREASRADHDLRLLVGHANLLDSLMLDLADAEQEQERWFNQTVSGATKGSSRSEHPQIQWAETLLEEPEEDWDAEDLSDEDSDLSEEEEDSDLEEDYAPVRRRAPSPVPIITETELEEDYDSDSDSEFEYDDAEDLDDLALTRSPSRQTPPELSHDEDEESEDDSMPPSPPQPILETFDEKQAHSTEISVSVSDPDFEHRYYVPQAQQPMIGAC
ncbi:hypothetical protein BJX76DRAFT_324396 [Aspergillus varians]